VSDDIPREVLLTTLDQVEALGSPLRMRILHLASEPRSVRELAERLDVPVTRLYYHVNMLDDAGLLEVVEVRKSGARLEKLYRVPGRSVRLSEDLLDAVDDPARAAEITAGVLLDTARVETEAMLERRFTGRSEPGSLGRTVVQLKPEMAEQFVERVEALIRELADSHDDHDASLDYAFTYVFVPAGLA
jgi:DNA-binding transcriptional ArsR family regulator